MQTKFEFENDYQTILRYHFSGGSGGGGTRDVRPPGPKFLHFHVVSGKIGQIVR